VIDNEYFEDNEYSEEAEYFESIADANPILFDHSTQEGIINQAVFEFITEHTTEFDLNSSESVEDAAEYIHTYLCSRGEQLRLKGFNTFTDFEFDDVLNALKTALR